MNTRLPLLAALALLAPAAAFAQEPAPQGPVVVPFQMLPSNHMVVDVKLNGQGPYTLIFDVGSPVTLLGNRAAKGAGLIDKENSFPFLFGARGAEEVEKLQVGDLVAEDVPVLIMDHPVVAALGKILGKPLDGLMGHTFFARYKTTIDYQAHTMAFEPVDHEISDLFAELPDRLMGPKKARQIIVEPSALLGLTLDDSAPDARVASVLPDSPASRAGLQPGDVLTELDGRWITRPADLYTATSSLLPGQPVPLLIRRQDQPQTLSLTPIIGF